MSEPFSPIDFHAYHDRELPEQLRAGRGRLAAAGARDLDPLAIRVRESGDAYTYRAHGDEILVSAGDADAKTVIEVEQQMWEGLVHDIESAPSLLYGGKAKGVRGNAMDFVDWEPALRAMYAGRPIYDPDAPMPAGLDGRPLRPEQSFKLADSDKVTAHYLKQMGYVLIRGVFSQDEVEAMLADSNALRETARPDDQQSWWGKREGGEPILVRVLNAHQKPLLAGLHDDARIQRLSQLPAEPLETKTVGTTNSVTVLWKQPGVCEGLGDLPWHRDCGMGGHALMCPTVNCSIHLGPATPGAGDLRFLPASWKASVRFADGNDESAPRGVSLNARPGDVSLHYGDVVHGAPPPESNTGPFRTSILIGWGKPGFKPHSGRDHYNDVLFQEEGNAVPDMREMARRSSEED
jgi:ectoine hydroxylase-related dioxygenase (phytanoyl-CoA dioxygenase family)